MKVLPKEGRIALILVALLVLMALTPGAIAIPGQLRLSTTQGTYVEDPDDAWIHESWVITDTAFNLDITNHQGKALHYLYLLVAVDKDPAGVVSIKVNGNTLADSDYNGVITANNKALVPNTDPDFEYPGHGIYNYGSGVRFAVVPITIPDDGVLAAGETMSVPIVIDLLTTGSVKVHFDAVGADRSGKAIAFVPPSEDVTQIPEFGTLALPVAAIIGLLFFFNHRKHKNE